MRIFLHLVILPIILFLLLFSLMPERKLITEIIEIVYIIPVLSFILFPMLRNKSRTNDRFQIGQLFFIIMIIILFIGNLNYFVVRYAYPSFNFPIRVTNLYWLAGVVMFSLGFIYYNNRQHKIIKYFYATKTMHYLLFFVISIVAFILIFAEIGLLPFLLGTDKRITAGSSSLLTRAWIMCVPAGILSFIQFYRNKRNLFALFIAILSIGISFLFNLRMYPFLILLSISLFIYSQVSKKRTLIILSIIGFLAYMLLNALFVENRVANIRDKNEVRSNAYLNEIQSRFIYQTFNEYQQLSSLMYRYKSEYLYGQTLINLPLGFIPAQVLAIFGVDKSEIQEINSAEITAKYFGSDTGGLRTGILGEFYLNFGYYGFLLMFFVGIWIGYLHNKLNVLDFWDVRYGLYLIIGGVTVYSLIGQIDAIGSSIGYFIIILVIVKILSKKELYVQRQ